MSSVSKHAVPFVSAVLSPVHERAESQLQAFSRAPTMPSAALRLMLRIFGLSGEEVAGLGSEALKEIFAARSDSVRAWKQHLSREEDVGPTRRRLAYNDRLLDDI